MKNIIFLIITVIATLSGCKDKELTPCRDLIECGINQRPLRVDGQDCQCTCEWPGNNLTNALENFCVYPNSYMALLDRRNDLDTFALSIRDNYNQHSSEIFRIRSSRKGSPFLVEEVISTPEGDSIVLDFLDAPDGSFDYWNHPDNEFDLIYRLKLTGFLPSGLNGDTLHATIHTLSMGNNQLRDPVDFTMVKVK